MHYLIISLFVSLPLFGQDFTFNKETGKAVPKFVGELKLVKGRVLRTTGGRPRVVKVGEKFLPKDVVATEKNSSMKILIADDTWLSLGPDSELVFSEFDFREKDDRDVGYELRKGQLAANVRRKVKSGAVNFRTRYTTMGIRGTKLMMNYREVGGKAISEYALVEGKALVTDSQGAPHELGAGERIVLIEDQKTKEATLEKLQLSPEDLENFASPEADEDKGIRPFMPYYEPKAVSVSAVDEGVVERSKKEKTTSGDGSFSNLKKLNEQLKDNQKKQRR